VIAAPVSMVAGIGNAAKNGILVKGGEAIENTKSSRVIAFDKTGTLTEGQPRVSDVKTFDVTKTSYLSCRHRPNTIQSTRSAESSLSMPKLNRGKVITKPEKSEIITGHGVMATVNNARVWSVTQNYWPHMMLK
jgi:Cd2+/Zn2+-exporting ATPase